MPSPDLDLRTTFDQAADLYLGARPRYPEDLFDDLTELCALTGPGTLLEIGAGPGNATLPLARRGHRITALEPGPALADHARQTLRAYPRVEVINTGYEDWEHSGSATFDLVYVANAWHWIDPEVKWSKTAQLLGGTGRLAVFDAGHAFPAGFDPFFTEIQSVYHRLGRRMATWPPTPPDQLPDPTPDYEASGHFTVDAVRRYLWATEYDADGYLDLLSTFSDHIAMSDADRTELFTAIRDLIAARPGGRITRHWISTLVIARPR